MGLLERVIFLCIGGVIGLIVGYIVGRLHEIEKRLDEVLKLEHKRDEGGFAKPSFLNVAVALVVALTAWAAFASQKAANDSDDSQKKSDNTQSQVVALALCNQEFLSKTITALNQRTEFSSSQAAANVDLQKSQAAFFSLLLGKPPATEAVRVKAAESYLDDLTNFVQISEKQKGAIVNNPYPTNEELSSCLMKNKKQSLPKEQTK